MRKLRVLTLDKEKKSKNSNTLTDLTDLVREYNRNNLFNFLEKLNEVIEINKDENNIHIKFKKNVILECEDFGIFSKNNLILNAENCIHLNPPMNDLKEN